MIKIGITGHRPHRLTVSEQRLARRVRGVLTSLIKAAGAARTSRSPVLEIISPIAEGTDRIVAREARALGQRLIALLPFTRRDYESTFGDATTTAEFRTLWKAADERVILGGSLNRAEAGYVAVGMVTLARSDMIITIWDGKPARGRGGTPEILQNALEWGIPIIWINAREDRKPVLLCPRRKAKVPSLMRVAKHPQALPAAVYRQLVRSARTPH
jgi:hypothetical protein